MDFNALSLRTAAQACAAAARTDQVAWAHNIAFEERVDLRRLAAFEALCGATASLEDAQARYVKARLEVATSVPDTFLPINQRAHLGSPDMDQMVVRIENLGRPLSRQGVSEDQFLEAFGRCPGSADDAALIEDVLAAWNDDRDLRPAFATFLSEVADDLAAANWPERVRDRLGLAHFNPVPGDTVLLAAFAFPVRTILDQSAPADASHRIAVPTVLDSRAWGYFFPAPRDLPCGRTMNLAPPSNDENLLAEILHLPVKYRMDQLKHVARLAAPIPRHGLKALRNAHLEAVRLASLNDAFGREIDSHVSD